MLDLAAVASSLFASGAWNVPTGIIGRAIPDLHRTIAALVALHDIGKFTRPFQGKMPELWPSVLGPCKPPPASPPHDTAGYWVLTDPQRVEPVGLFDRWLAGQHASPWRAVAGHHGCPPLEPSTPRVDRSVACEPCLDSARVAADAVVATLKPPPLPPLADHDVARLGVVWTLAATAMAGIASRLAL